MNETIKLLVVIMFGGMAVCMVLSPIVFLWCYFSPDYRKFRIVVGEDDDFHRNYPKIGAIIAKVVPIGTLGALLVFSYFAARSIIDLIPLDFEREDWYIWLAIGVIGLTLHLIQRIKKKLVAKTETGKIVSTGNTPNEKLNLRKLIWRVIGVLALVVGIFCFAFFAKLWLLSIDYLVENTFLNPFFSLVVCLPLHPIFMMTLYPILAYRGFIKLFPQKPLRRNSDD